jgi:hypothetical protein
MCQASDGIGKVEKSVPAAQDRGGRRGGRGTGAHKKRAWRELSGHWIAHDTGDNVIDFIKRLSARTEISPLRLVGWMELSR